MLRYEVPVRYVARETARKGHGFQRELLARGRYLYSGLSDAELREPAPIETVEGAIDPAFQTDRTHLVDVLLGLDPDLHRTRMDPDFDAKSGPFHFDIALAWALDQQRVDDALRFLWYTTELGVTTDPTNDDVLGGFERLREGVETVAAETPHADARVATDQLWETLRDA